MCTRPPFIFFRHPFICRCLTHLRKEPLSVISGFRWLWYSVYARAPSYKPLLIPGIEEKITLHSSLLRKNLKPGQIIDTTPLT
ncbi:hypothetical protein ACS0TY_030243 [Phlomoides rotata]